MSNYTRKTKETDIHVQFDSTPGESSISTSYPFLTHMLEAFSCHGNFSLEITAEGDIEVDPHHLIEDSGYCLGRALSKASDFTSILRAGSFTFPMDDSLALVSVDLCGRSCSVWNVSPSVKTINGIHISVFSEFFQGFARGAGAAVHAVLLYGEDPHHAVEAVFKAFGRALSQALQKSDTTRTTKGVIDA